MFRLRQFFLFKRFAGFAATFVICLIFFTVEGCGKRQKRLLFNIIYDKIGSAGEPQRVKLSADRYRAIELSPDGKSLLYVVEHDPGEGWGFGHGRELVSYDLERNLKLPLGKMGRSKLIKVVQIGDELRNAVVRTVDSSGDGVVDEKDCNQLYLTTTFGLEQEPISPIGFNVERLWPDPSGKWIVFSGSYDWEGRKKKKGEKRGPKVYRWDSVTRRVELLKGCKRFYGFSPEAEEFACMISSGEKGEGIEVGIFDRATGKRVKKVTIQTDATSDAVLLGGGVIAYTKEEVGEGGKRHGLYLRFRGGRQVRVTGSSVDSKILGTGGDGSLIFVTVARNTVADFTALMVLSPDGVKVKTIFRWAGTEISSLTISPDGKMVAFIKKRWEKAGGAGSAYTEGNSMIYIAKTNNKPVEALRKEVASEYVEALSASVVRKLKANLGSVSFVQKDRIYADIERERVFIPISLDGEGEGEGSAPDSGAVLPKFLGEKDNLVVLRATSIKQKVVDALRGKKYEAVVYSDDLRDGVCFIRYEEDFNRYFTYFSAYGQEIPLISEYKVQIEDLTFRKTPGCKDPRLVQLHCTGWMVGLKDVLEEGYDSFKIECRAIPLNPVQLVRREVVEFSANDVASEPFGFDVVVDKVDPRRSGRYSYYLDIYSGGKKIPYYDAKWADASAKWVWLMRQMDSVIGFPIMPYSGSGEINIALSNWIPQTVVRQEAHLDVHLFIKPLPEVPAKDDGELWRRLAEKVVEEVKKHTMRFDEQRAGEIVVSLYRGSELAIEYNLKEITRQTKRMLMEIAAGGAKESKKVGRNSVEEKKDVVKSHLPDMEKRRTAVVKGVDRAEIQAAIKKKLPQIKYCYAREVEKRDFKGGTITVTIVVSQSGKVASAQLEHATIKDARLHSCILKAVKRIKFPPSKTEGNYTIRYPFRFAEKPL